MLQGVLDTLMLKTKRVKQDAHDEQLFSRVR